MQWLNTCILVGILLMILFLLQMIMKRRFVFRIFLKCLCYGAEKEYFWVVFFLVLCLNVTSIFFEVEGIAKTASSKVAKGSVLGQPLPIIFCCFFM